MGVFSYAANAAVNLDIDFDKNVFVDSAITSSADAFGLSALANAFADSVGSEDAIVETDSFSQTDGVALIAQAGSTSLAASGEPVLDLAVVRQIDLALILDATGSTDEDWVDPDGAVAVDFTRFDGVVESDDQNAGAPTDPPEGGIDGPADAGDVIDAEIAAFKNLLISLARDARDEEAADPNLNVVVNGIAIKHFTGGGIRPQAFDFDGIFFDSTDAEIDAFLQTEVFDFLEDSGSNGATNYNPAYLEAVNFLNGTVLNGNDPDGPEVRLVALTDADQFDLTDTDNATIAALDGVAGLERTVFVVANENTSAATIAAARLDDLDNTGPGAEVLLSIGDLLLA